MLQSVEKTFHRGQDLFFSSDILNRLWSKSMKGKAICLCYHRVDDSGDLDFLERQGLPVISKSDLRRDIRFLKQQGFQFITFEDIRANKGLNPSQPSVILSFDDGYKDLYTHAREILESEGVRGVFFQSTSIVDSEELLWAHAIFWYCRDKKNLQLLTHLAKNIYPEEIEAAEKKGIKLSFFLIEQFPFMRSQHLVREMRKIAGIEDEKALAARLYPSHADLKEASAFGHEIASHGHRHFKRSAVSKDLFEEDLKISIQKIKEWTGKTPRSYAYPHGNCSASDRWVVAKYFSHVVTVKKGLITAKSNPLELPRFYWSGKAKNELRRKRWLLTGAS